MPFQGHADQTVTNCSDPNALKKALVKGGTITFDCDGTFSLSNTIPITNTNAPIIVDGTDHTITISGSGSTNGTGVGIFSIGPGVDLTIVNITFTDGQNTNGGALYINSNAVVTLSNCTFTGNTATGTNGTQGANGASHGNSSGGNGTVG